MALIAASSAAIGGLTVDAIISAIGRLSCFGTSSVISSNVSVNSANSYTASGPIPLVPGEAELNMARLDEGGHQLAEARMVGRCGSGFGHVYALLCCGRVGRNQDKQDHKGEH